MSTRTSRCVQLAKRPVGMPQQDDFQVVDESVAAPAAGQIQVRNLCMSVDPYMRGRMVDRKSYVPPFQIGETLTGGAIGVVEASEHPDFAAGDHVESPYGWREAFTADTDGITNLGQQLAAPASAYLGVLGMPGMTAYVGLLGAGELKDGETVFVSGAAGAVGSIVGQIAKLKDCRVVGSAGSADKLDWLTGELGFDHAFDYHDGNLLAALREGAPNGLDVYFDNVGADHLQAAIMHMRPFGRIALCGAIALYNDTEPRPGPNNLAVAIGLGLTLRGFIVSHYDHMRADFRRDMTDWVTSGKVSYRETTFEGVDRAWEAFQGLFTGANTGKMIVQI
ncbi:MAG: NADP-dependent oxidoreductase [Pseudomonadota bacterium]